jgi:glutamate-1-semialdehyde 2,1-aminomutase
VLIFDEVTTGFRCHAGGAQCYLGTVPDLAVFAKSLANGYAMAAVVGRREIMSTAARMFISSTPWSDPIGLAAALATLREISRRDVPTQLHQTGRQLQDRISAVAQAAGVPAVCAGVPTAPVVRFQVDDPATATLSTLYIQEMAKRGCHGYAGFTLNAAQGPAELDQTEAAAREVFALLRGGLDSGRLETLLECDLSRDAFRRLVN